MGCQKSTYYYRRDDRRDRSLKEALQEKAYRYPRWGYRNLLELLRREGWKDNHKRVYRVYAAAGLQVGTRKRRPKTKYRGEKLEEPKKRNELWVMDFMQDQLVNGRKIRLLTVMDVHTRESLAIEVDTSISGERVCRVLDRIKGLRGLPERIGTDNGPEFRGMKLDQWAYKNKVKLQFIPPGQPTKNAYIESFNAIVRDDCLNQHWFLNLEDARNKIEVWRYEYNTVRPHGSLGKKTPAEFAARHPLGGGRERIKQAG